LLGCGLQIALAVFAGLNFAVSQFANRPELEFQVHPFFTDPGENECLSFIEENARTRFEPSEPLYVESFGMKERSTTKLAGP
jgi:hypothetical protein